MGEDEHKSRDIDHEKDLEEVYLEPGSNCCIYRVPQHFRKINEEAYTPSLISIGPLHYGKKELMRMENQKKRYWSKFGERPEVNAEILEKFKTYIETQQQKIRACYSVSSTLISSKYVEIILRDAIFIIELFLGKDERSEDFLLKDPLGISITTDLLLLENQLPYFILNELYSIAFPTGKGNPSGFFNIAEFFFEGMNPLLAKAAETETETEAEAEDEAAEQAFPTSKGHPSVFFNVSDNFVEGTSVLYPLLAEAEAEAEAETETEAEAETAEQPHEQRQEKHFTDILRRSLLMTVKSNRKGDKLIYDLPCATKLNQSGLEFVGTEDECLLNVRVEKRKYGKWMSWFEVNEIKIPRIGIYDKTECLLRNLMVLEMFHYPEETHICNYAMLMDYLVDTEKDVDLLVEKKIIFNGLGDNKAICDMFNNLCSHVKISDSCYYKDAENMKSHYSNNWNHVKAALKNVYFNNIWTGTATFAATFLLILNVIQTVCSIVQL